MAASLRHLLIVLIALGIAIDMAIISVLLFDLQPKLGGGVNLEPNVEITLYGGEITTEEGVRYGYGLSPDEIMSPGPNLEFKQGDVVRIIFKNVGEIPHTLAIVQRVDPMNPELLNSYDTGNVLQGEEAILVVQFNQVGTLHYQCTVPGHASLGMWGNITVTP